MPTKSRRVPRHVGGRRQMNEKDCQLKIQKAALWIRTFVTTLVVIATGATPRWSTAAGSVWKAGTARAAITPKTSMWMSGYAARTKPSQGVVHDLWAKALALEDPN